MCIRSNSPKQTVFTNKGWKHKILSFSQNKSKVSLSQLNKLSKISAKIICKKTNFIHRYGVLHNNQHLLYWVNAKPTAYKKTTTITTSLSLIIIILSQQFSHIIAFFSSTEFINFSINPTLKDKSTQKAQTNSTLHRTRIHTNLFFFLSHTHTHIIYSLGTNLNRL
jgi:hypothetical protein